MEWRMPPAVTSLNTTTDACWFYCLKDFWGVEPRGTGRSGHAGHLTGCGGRLWRERWLNGSDVGRLQGTAEVGNIRTGGLVWDTTGLTPNSKIRLRRHFHTAAPSIRLMFLFTCWKINDIRIYINSWLAEKGGLLMCEIILKVITCSVHNARLYIN